jgi:hypothetical protein
MRHFMGQYRCEHRVVVRKRVQQSSVDEDVLAGQRKRVDLGLRPISLAHHGYRVSNDPENHT